MPKKLTAFALVACLSATGLVAADRTARAEPEDPATAAGNAGTPARADGSGEGDGISWGACADQDAVDAGIRCGELSVPADWNRPREARTTIRVARIPAESPEQRVGALLVNTGGPGPMIRHLADTSKRLTELTQWFDVIAFDPRGIGTSSGIACPGAPSKTRVLFSTDRRAWQRVVRDNRAWEESCREEAGALAGHLNAWQVAHDMEAMRKALGEGKLNYYGNSYGTVYGQTYAELFPTRVRRMFLDSAANHTARSPLAMTAPMAEGADREFRAFGEWCETDTDCALHPRNARDVWDELMARARRAPLPAPGVGDDASVGPERLRLATMNPVSNRSRWPEFAEALAEARAGDASALYLPEPPSSSPDTSAASLAWCSDFPFRQGWGAMRVLENRLRAVAPRVGWLMARTQYGRCAGLRHQGTFPPRRIDAPEGLPPVLVVNGRRDLATPPAGGRAVADQLPGAVWIGAESDHAVYLGGNRCVRDIAHRYLTTGELPASGTVCPASDNGERRTASSPDLPHVG